MAGNPECAKQETSTAAAPSAVESDLHSYCCTNRVVDVCCETSNAIAASW